MKDLVEEACNSGSGNGRLSDRCCRPAIMAVMSELGSSLRRLEMRVVLAVARKVEALDELQQKTWAWVSFSSQRGH